MNPFEKIFNYQIISRTADSGTFMVTSHERAWLKTMLGHPAAIDAFAPETLAKLSALLEQDQAIDIERHLTQKAGSQERQVYHPLLRSLRGMIRSRSGIRLSYEIKGGRVYEEQSGLPYKLEYSMVKREWYLLWYHLRHRAWMSTRLQKITAVSPEPVEPALADRLLREISESLENGKTTVVIEIVRQYNQELSRILYAFSCFEKDVEYDEAGDMYRVKVCLPRDEQEYFLSKLRFLGKRVRVVEGRYLKRRLLEAATKALERYGVNEEADEELTS